MELRSLRAFAEVADAGSFSRAATALGIAQSALSRQVSALEREVGGRLFHRTGRGVALTELGVRLAPRARALMAGAGEFLAMGRDARASPAGDVELALLPPMARQLAGPLCARLRRDFPRIRLRAREGYSGDIEEWLETGRVEVAVFNRYRGAPARDAEPLLRSEMHLVGARDHPAVRPPEVPFRALAGIPLAVPRRPNALTALLTSLAASRRIQLDFAMEANSTSIIADAVANAGICTVFPRLAVAGELDEGTLRAARIVNPVIVQTTWLAIGTHRPATEAARVVARLIRQIAGEFVRSGRWAGSMPAQKSG